MYTVAKMDNSAIRKSTLKVPDKYLENYYLVQSVIAERNEQNGSFMVAHTSKGRSVFATREFAKGDFIVEYSGVLIKDKSEMARREELYDELDKGSFMFYFEFRNCKFCIDATEETSRIGRLVNHSRRSANCHPQILEINGIPRLILVATKTINSWEEILYPYGDTSSESMKKFSFLQT